MGVAGGGRCSRVRRGDGRSHRRRNDSASAICWPSGYRSCWLPISPISAARARLTRKHVSGIRQVAFWRGWHYTRAPCPLMLLPLIGGSYETLRPVMGEVLQQFAQRWLPPGASLSEQALANQTEWALFLLPAGFAAQWLVLCAFNLYLAGRVVRASGAVGTRLARPFGHQLSAGTVHPFRRRRCWLQLAEAWSALPASVSPVPLWRPICLAGLRSRTLSASGAPPGWFGSSI